MKSGDSNQTDKTDNSDVALLMAGVDPSSDEYYPTVVINALLKILKDPSLSQQYQPATQAILNIFRSLQLKMVSFLPQVCINSLQRHCCERNLIYFIQLTH
jgi:FKBP12-rapamycin complex-associated protein